MPIFTKNDKKILFIHIPRSGGMSIEDLFLQNNWIPDLLHYHSKHIIKGPYFNCTPQHFHNEILKEILPKNITHKFTIVRNPIERFKSEINFHLAEKRYSEKSYDEIVDFFISEYDKNNFVFDNHLRPQHEFISSDVEVFKFENCIFKIREILNEHFNLELEKKEVFKNELSYKSGVKSKDIEISKISIEKINKLYAQDFKLFNY